VKHCPVTGELVATCGCGACDEDDQDGPELDEDR